MKDTTKILEEFYEKFPNGLFRKEQKPIVDLQSMISGGNKDVYGYTESFIDCKKEIEDIFATSIQEAIAEERSRVRGNLPEIRVSALSLLLNDCANCGQVINRSFVDDLTCRIQDEYKQKILLSLDKPLKERTKL